MFNQKEYMKEYYKKHKDELNKKNLEWHKNHPEYRKEYYKNNKEKMLEYNKNWQQNNKEKFMKLCQASRKRRIERLQADGCSNAWSVVVTGAIPKYK